MFSFKRWNFAGGTRMYSCSPNFEKGTLKLSNDTHLILNWFRIKSVVANLGKFQIMFLGSNIDNSKITFIIENKKVKSRSEVKLLVITIDDKLSFTTHIENLCSTAGNRLRAFARIHKFVLFLSFLSKRLSESYIGYCRLIWLFCSKAAKNIFNKIRKWMM